MRSGKLRAVPIAVVLPPRPAAITGGQMVKRRSPLLLLVSDTGERLDVCEGGFMAATCAGEPVALADEWKVTFGGKNGCKSKRRRGCWRTLQRPPEDAIGRCGFDE